MRATLHTRLHGLILLTTLLVWSGSCSVFALTPDSPHTWESCLEREARALDIPVPIFRALVYTESRNHPWAFGWTDQLGNRHSVFPNSKTEAYQLLTWLQRQQHKVDLGLGQINSTNWPTLAQTLNISPRDLLEPCHNLTAARTILGEQLTRHGRTWQALAGYNGSVGSSKYILLVHGNLCRQTPNMCTTPPQAEDLLPSTPLTLASLPNLFTLIPDPSSMNPVELQPEESDTLDSPVPTLTQKVPTMTWLDAFALSFPTAHTVLSLSLNILLPFAILIGLVVIICYGLLVILWAIGLVKEGFRSLLTGRPSFPIPVPAFLGSTPSRSTLNRRTSF